MLSQKFLMPAITQVYGIYLNEITTPNGGPMPHSRRNNPDLVGALSLSDQVTG